MVHQKHWRKRRFEDARLYAITDFAKWTENELMRIEDACRGGVDVLQLRSKTLDRKALKVAGRQIRNITSRWNVLFIVNDFPDLARDIEADGVHLGQEDMNIQQARSVWQDGERLIGKSTHSLEQARQAESEGADYIGVGPIYSTPTKPDYPSVGVELIQKVRSEVRIPYVAIGGIDFDHLNSVLAEGAKCIAVVRAVFGQENTRAAARQLKERILSFDYKNAAHSKNVSAKFEMR